MRWIVQGYYVARIGWEELCEEDTKEEAEKRLSEYEDNEPQYLHRIKEKEST